MMISQSLDVLRLCFYKYVQLCEDLCDRHAQLE